MAKSPDISSKRFINLAIRDATFRNAAELRRGVPEEVLLDLGYSSPGDLGGVATSDVIDLSPTPGDIEAASKLADRIRNPAALEAKRLELLRGSSTDRMVARAMSELPQVVNKHRD